MVNSGPIMGVFCRRAWSEMSASEQVTVGWFRILTWSLGTGSVLALFWTAVREDPGGVGFWLAAGLAMGLSATLVVWGRWQLSRPMAWEEQSFAASHAAVARIVAAEQVGGSEGSIGVSLKLDVLPSGQSAFAASARVSLDIMLLSRVVPDALLRVRYLPQRCNHVFVDDFHTEASEGRVLDATLQRRGGSSWAHLSGVQIAWLGLLPGFWLVPVGIVLGAWAGNLHGGPELFWTPVLFGGALALGLFTSDEWVARNKLNWLEADQAGALPCLARIMTVKRVGATERGTRLEATLELDNNVHGLRAARTTFEIRALDEHLVMPGRFLRVGLSQRERGWAYARELVPDPSPPAAPQRP